MKTILKQIRECLEQAGIDVYYPAQHKGECIAPYVVVKYSGATDAVTVSSDIATYDLMCYVPEKQYSKLIELLEQTKEAMRGLFPLVRQEKTEIASYYDSEIKAHMISISYINYRKIKYRR